MYVKRESILFAVLIAAVKIHENMSLLSNETVYPDQIMQRNNSNTTKIYHDKKNPIEFTLEVN